jgi:hypothetical protein
VCKIQELEMLEKHAACAMPVYDLFTTFLAMISLDMCFPVQTAEIQEEYMWVKPGALSGMRQRHEDRRQHTHHWKHKDRRATGYLITSTRENRARVPPRRAGSTTHSNRRATTEEKGRPPETVFSCQKTLRGSMNLIVT